MISLFIKGLISVQIIGIIVYAFCGVYVASPALGSAGGTMKKICYGLALPGLFITATIYTHVSCHVVDIRRIPQLSKIYSFLPSIFSCEL